MKKSRRVMDLMHLLHFSEKWQKIDEHDGYDCYSYRSNNGAMNIRYIRRIGYGRLRMSTNGLNISFKWRSNVY
jgi:hypothetical protein